MRNEPPSISGVPSKIGEGYIVLEVIIGNRAGMTKATTRLQRRV